MKIVTLPRGTGKTTRLVAWLMTGVPLTRDLPNTWNRRLVVATVRERDRVVAQLVDVVRHSFGPNTAPEVIGSWIDQLSSSVLLPEQMFHLRTVPRIGEITVAVDELDAVLRVLFGLPVEVATLSPDNPPGGSL